MLLHIETNDIALKIYGFALFKYSDMDIQERIRKIIDVKFNGNVSAFCRYTGIKQPTMNTIIGERRSKPSYEVLNSIVSADALNINPKWLLTGDGAMLKDPTSDISDRKTKDEAIPEAIRTNETASILIDEVPIIDSITDIKVLQFITKLCYNYFDKINTIHRLEEQIRQMHGYISKLEEQAGAVGQDSNKETQETGTDEAKLYHDETR